MRRSRPAASRSARPRRRWRSSSPSAWARALDAPLRRRHGGRGDVAGPVAAGPGKEKVELDAADQAAARAVVLRRSDLGAGWNGGRIEPDLSGGPTCPNYHPKVSDLVITGAAASDFRRTGVDFANEVEVLRTAGMVSRDWRRSIVPEAVPCL